MPMSRFPVSDVSLLKERAMRSGTPIFQGSTGALVRFTGRTGIGGNSIAAADFYNSNKTARYITSLYLAASAPCLIQLLGPTLQISGTAVGNTTVQSVTYSVGPQGITIPLDMFIGVDFGILQGSLITRFDQDPRINVATVTNSGGTTLTVAKSGNTTEVSNSQGTYSYTMTVSNNSGSSATGTHTVTDTLPLDCNYISASGTGWSFSVASGVLVATSTTTIANGGTSTITVTLQSKSSTIVTISAHGYQVDADFFHDSAPCIWAGTSITFGAGVNTFNTNYTYLVRNWLRDTKNVQNRVINRAVPGSTSSHHEYLRAFSGRYTLNDNPLVAFWEHGINDVIQAVPQATTVANMQAYARHWTRQNPNTIVAIISPYPNSNVGNEASLATLRTALAAGVAALANPKVIFISGTGNMYDPVTQSGTYTTDGTHLNDAGCALAASIIQAALNPYF